MVKLTEKYTILKKIGKGGFGSVYLAKNIKTEELVAIKMEKVDCENSSLKHEGKMLLKLQGIVGVPKLYGYGVCDEMRYVLMEYCGESVKCIEKKDYIELLKILKCIHDRCVKHNDIKKSNISKKENKLYILDYGLSYYSEDYKEDEEKLQNISGDFCVDTKKY